MDAPTANHQQLSPSPPRTPPRAPPPRAPSAAASRTPPPAPTKKRTPPVPRRPPLRLCLEPGRVEAGVDEAGRGCLAGPVVAAAVVWDAEGTRDDPMLALIQDSKRLSPAQRERARAYVEEHALAWAVCAMPATEVDRINILRASHKAMHGALDALLLAPAAAPARSQRHPVDCRGGRSLDQLDAVLADGDRFAAYISPRTGEFVPHACVIEGDGAFVSIAAASILAKTHRDRWVRTAMHQRFPQYGFDRHVGYGTPAHLQALQEHGMCAEHRTSFRRGGPAAVSQPTTAGA